MEQPINSTKATPQKIAITIIKYIKRIVIVIALLLLGVVCSAFIITYFYGNKVKQYAIEQLNSRLNTPIYVDPKNIDFSIIRNFPFASVDFKEVNALEVTTIKKKETLFRAGEISFLFSLTDIFNKSYRIKKMEISDVDLNLKVDEKGNDNYHFLKTSIDTAKASSPASKNDFNLSLDKIILNNIRVKYNNKQLQHYYSLVVNQTEFSGKFSSKQYRLSARASLFIQMARVKNNVFLTEKPCELDLLLLVDNVTNTTHITTGKVEVAGVGMEVTGDVVYQREQTGLNLRVAGDNIDIFSLLTLLPARYKKDIQDYKSTGNFYVKGTIKGTYSDKTNPAVNASFGINRGRLSTKKSSIALENIGMRGTLVSNDNGRGSGIKIHDFSAMLGKGSIKGNFKVDNFNEPYITANAVANFQLNELHKFINLDTIVAIDGDLQANVSFGGKLKPNAKYTADDYAHALASGNISLSNVAMKLKNNPLEFKDINGSFTFKQNELAINSFSGNMSNSDFKLQGVLKNILAYLLADKEILTVDANLKSNNINLNELLADKNETVMPTTTIAGNAVANNPNYNLHFSNYLNLELTSAINHLVFRKFNADNISGTIELKNQQLTAKSIKLETMEGTVNIEGFVNANKEDKITFGCNAELNSLNIQKLVGAFENFGQKYLIDKNIKGKGTAAIRLSASASPSLEVDKSAIAMRCDLTVENGELIAFKPLIDLGKDLEKDLILRELIDVPEFRSKIAHIRFKTLKNRIEIKDQKISFSATEIKSSAMDIDFFGAHYFNNHIDYHFSFYLPQLLTLQAKKRKEQNKDFGEEQDDGLGRVLHYYMTGTTEKPLFKRDLKAEKARRKENIKKEKQNIKTLLNDEFGLFKKDTVNNKSKKKIAPKKENGFKVKWGDKKEKEEKEEDF